MTLQNAECAQFRERSHPDDGMDAWLRRSLAEQFGRYAHEPVPEALLHLLPPE